MNNLKKLGVTALAGSLVAVSAQAGEMSVNGSANFTWAQNNVPLKVKVLVQTKDLLFLVQVN